MAQMWKRIPWCQPCTQEDRIKVPGGGACGVKMLHQWRGDLAQSITVFMHWKGKRIDSWTCFSRSQHPAHGFRVVRTEFQWACVSGAAELEFDDVLSPTTGHYAEF